jgi:GTPase SAR1 family protein
MGKYEDIANSTGMKVLRNVVKLETGSPRDIVLRTITEPFWNKVIDATEKCRVCVVGTPGVGKTTITPILIRLIFERMQKLQKAVTVIYNVRSITEKGFVFIFTSSGTHGKINTEAIPQKIFAETNYNDKSTFYVVDPGLTKNNCNPPIFFKGRVIIVASPDERHWGESSFGKEFDDTVGMFMYFPAWNLCELLPSLSVFDPSNTIDKHEVESRFFKFGGVPRSIFATNYNLQCNYLEDALKKLSLAKYRSLIKDKCKTGLDTFGEDLPKGILLSLVLADDDGGSFQKKIVKFSSEYVYRHVATEYMKDLWDSIVPNESTFDAYLFETYCRKILLETPFAPTIRLVRGKTNKQWIQTESLISGIKKEVMVDNIVTSAINTENTIFFPQSKQNKFIDFMYRSGDTYNMFQATISERHSSKASDLYEIVIFLCTQSEHILGKSPQLLNFYYIVPSFRYEKFKTRPVDPEVKALALFKVHEKESILYKNWKKLVSIKVLEVKKPQ